MSQPVKLSDSLVLDARLAGDALQRSIAGQVEFWARLGKALEPLLQGNQVLALSRSAAAKSLSECLADVDTPEGRKRVHDSWKTGSYPHYEPVPETPELLARIDEDGTRTVGRFVNRKFVAAKSKATKR
jgi:hypothetical protein